MHANIVEKLVAHGRCCSLIQMPKIFSHFQLLKWIVKWNICTRCSSGQDQGIRCIVISAWGWVQTCWNQQQLFGTCDCQIGLKTERRKDLKAELSYRLLLVYLRHRRQKLPFCVWRVQTNRITRIIFTF